LSILDTEAIKKIVRCNFDRSAELYENFEEKYGLFKFLTAKLADKCNVQPGSRVCDIGCGTGTSSFVLSELVGNVGSVIGMDFSEEMLKIANEKLKASSSNNIEFICCDATELVKHIDHELDSVLYNACIFLIPEPIDTLNAAHKKLVPGGTVGMNYLLGIFDSDSEGSENMNLFNYVRDSDQPFSPYGRAINDPSKHPEILSEVGFTEKCRWMN
jgi:ubiquinone/menaquinone biosynthesis C-methylase UbiE